MQKVPDFRSNLWEGPGVFSPEGCTRQEVAGAEESRTEIDYCKILNANLPQEIQVVAWAPCTDLSYSARSGLFLHLPFDMLRM